jgi:methylmalonyl-CoA/ethylmalonyl-CoA epimerase
LPGFLKIEHLGIAVADLEKANKLFHLLSGNPHYKVETVESENVSTSFFKVGESKIELVQASNEKSAIAKFIEKKGEGIHHVAFEVEDIVNEMLRLKNAGFELLSDVPKRGADNKLICFVHPKSTGGILLELTQEII